MAAADWLAHSPSQANGHWCVEGRECELYCDYSIIRATVDVIAKAAANTHQQHCSSIRSLPFQVAHRINPPHAIVVHWTLKKKRQRSPPYAFPLPNGRTWKDSTAPSDERILCALLAQSVWVLKWFALSRHDDGFIVTTGTDWHWPVSPTRFSLSAGCFVLWKTCWETVSS